MRVQTKFRITKELEKGHDSADVVFEVEIELSKMWSYDPDSERVGRCVEAAKTAFEKAWQE